MNPKQKPFTLTPEEAIAIGAKITKLIRTDPYATSYEVLGVLCDEGIVEVDLPKPEEG